MIDQPAYSNHFYALWLANGAMGSDVIPVTPDDIAQFPCLTNTPAIFIHQSRTGAITMHPCAPAPEGHQS